MQIEDERTLSVLMTAMYVAKWESDDDNAHVSEIAGSPVFARLYNELIDEVIRRNAGKPTVVREWESWRAIEQRPDQLERTRGRIQRLRVWSSWSREQKQQMVEYQLEPVHGDGGNP